MAPGKSQPEAAWRSQERHLELVPKRANAREWEGK